VAKEEKTNKTFHILHDTKCNRLIELWYWSEWLLFFTAKWAIFQPFIHL